MARTRNKIDASKGKQWRWRETFNPIQPETHWSSPFNPKKMRNKGRKSDRRRQWRRQRSTAARGRKIDERKKDWSDERKKERVVRLRKRGTWELGTERREKKWLKNYMHMLQYRAYLHGYCSNLHLYISLHRLMWEFFLLILCKMSTFFHFAQFYTILHQLM